MTPTHPRAREVSDYLTTARVHLQDAVRAVPETLRDAAPAAGRWSVAQILQHLSIVNHGIARLITKRVTDGKVAGLGRDPGTTSILWTLDVARLLNRQEAMTSPERTRPGDEVTVDAAWEALTGADAAIQAALLEADGLALDTITHPHAFLGPLNLYQWVAFAAAHEFRHAAQIRETAAAMAQV